MTDDREDLSDPDDYEPEDGVFVGNSEETDEDTQET